MSYQFTANTSALKGRLGILGARQISPYTTDDFNEFLIFGPYYTKKWGHSNSLGFSTHLGANYKKTQLISKSLQLVNYQFSTAFNKIRPSGRGHIPQEGFHISAKIDYDNYQSEEDIIAVGFKWSAYFSDFMNFLGKNQTSSLKLFNANYSLTQGNLPSVTLAPISSNLISSNNYRGTFQAKGYSSGTFYANNNYFLGGAEFHTPAVYPYWGASKYIPVILKRVHLALITEALNFNGIILDDQIIYAENNNTTFWSYGAELHSSFIFGYNVPINLVLGLYKGENTDYKLTKGLTLGFNLQIGLPF